ncbi:MAG: ABC transporter permease [Rhodospirillales bacterium]
MKLAFAIARRELRGGLKGFRIFLACLALGVAAVAGVGSLAAAINGGLRADGQTLLGGDVSLRTTHKPITAEQRAWLDAKTERLAATVEMRANAFSVKDNGRRLVELKAVDGAYPLFGAIELTGAENLHSALARSGGVWGAAAHRGLTERLGLNIGDAVRVGELNVEIRALIDKEPDRGTQAFNFGPRLMIALAALPETELIRPGSVVRYFYRAELPGELAPGALREAAAVDWPEAGWRTRDLENAAPSIQRFVDRVGAFMIIVGLTALLVGGVGVGNAVRTFLQSKTAVIATLKCLGAPSRLIFQVYLVQVGVIALLGIAIGLLAGVLAPLAALSVLGESLPVRGRFSVYPEPLVTAAVFGVLVTLVFSLWPLARARTISGGALFRDAAAPAGRFPGWKAAGTVTALAALLSVLAVVTSAEPWLAVRFAVGAGAALLIFWVLALAVVRAARAAPRARNALLRLAIANLHRPGAATAGVVMSLGMGLTVLAAVAMLEDNLNTELSETLRGEAPGYYFIDLQPDQLAPFQRIAEQAPYDVRIETVPMLRGRITALKGVPVSEITPPPDEAWILQGDRGVTWTAGPPPDLDKIIRGDWWPEDYAGPQLVSFDAEAAEAFGLDIGDTLTVSILGRSIEARIANWRQIDWNDLGINFVMVFSPGVLQSAPGGHIATAYLDEQNELLFEDAVVRALPNVSAIRVKEVLSDVQVILGKIALAIRVIATAAVAAGILVLAGAAAAGRQQRIYDSVVMKVLGATRRDLALAYALEYGALGLVTAAIAAVLGGAASWFVITQVMGAAWTVSAGTAAWALGPALLVIISAGMAGVWPALNRKAAPLLRNE